MHKNTSTTTASATTTTTTKQASGGMMRAHNNKVLGMVYFSESHAKRLINRFCRNCNPAIHQSVQTATPKIKPGMSEGETDLL